MLSPASSSQDFPVCYLSPVTTKAWDQYNTRPFFWSYLHHIRASSKVSLNPHLMLPPYLLHPPKRCPALLWFLRLSFLSQSRTDLEFGNLSLTGLSNFLDPPAKKKGNGTKKTVISPHPTGFRLLTLITVLQTSTFVLSFSFLLPSVRTCHSARSTWVTGTYSLARASEISSEEIRFCSQRHVSLVPFTSLRG